MTITEIIFAVAAPVLGLLLAIIGYFLRAKDREFQEYKETRAKTEKLLFDKHDEDARELAELKIKIASDHYTAERIDSIVSELKVSFKEDIHDLRDSIRSDLKDIATALRGAQ